MTRLFLYTLLCAWSCRMVNTQKHGNYATHWKFGNRMKNLERANRFDIIAFIEFFLFASLLWSLYLIRNRKYNRKNIRTFLPVSSPLTIRVTKKEKKWKNESQHNTNHSEKSNNNRFMWHKKTSVPCAIEHFRGEKKSATTTTYNRTKRIWKLVNVRQKNKIIKLTDCKLKYFFCSYSLCYYYDLNACELFDFMFYFH